MNNIDSKISAVLLLILIVKIIYELYKGNSELSHTYLKYLVIALSTLTIGIYTITSHLDNLSLENNKEIYQLEIREDNENNENNENNEDNEVVKKRLEFLYENKVKIDDMSKDSVFIYSFFIISSLVILLTMIFIEKISLQRVINKNQQV
ncbi:MAG: hypothetical protein ACNI28_09080 [Arcobacter sp.]|uniref:hypothetical protein n=1 Tax=Arcobacter sp. TaxID=1872629 RepID=UPI003AFF88E3